VGTPKNFIIDYTRSKNIAPTKLDEHELIGDRYCDVLRETYERVEVSKNRCKLLLTSDIRVSTRFNVDAGIWAYCHMADIQHTRLHVIKSRANL
jgi:hypothetical protein